MEKNRLKPITQPYKIVIDDSCSDSDVTSNDDWGRVKIPDTARTLTQPTPVSSNTTLPPGPSSQSQRVEREWTTKPTVLTVPGLMIPTVPELISRLCLNTRHAKKHDYFALFYLYVPFIKFFTIIWYCA